MCVSVLSNGFLVLPVLPMVDLVYICSFLVFMFLALVVLQTVDALPGVKARVRSRHVSFLFLFSIDITHTVTRCTAVVWTCWVVALLVKL